MRNFRRIISIAIFSLLLSLQVHPATPGAQNGPPSGQPGQGGVNRADPCVLVPSPQGEANGIEKLCELGGSAGIAKGDFNGDGIADLAVAAPDETRSTLGLCFPNFSCNTISHAGAGAVNILYGSSTGLARPSPGTAQVLEGGPIQNGGHFGRALAAGKFRGNGVSDLAVAAPGAVHNGRTIGSISVFFSSTGGAGLSVNTSQIFFADAFSGAGTVLGTATLAFPNNMSMTWGDFNGDGVGDLAAEVIISGSTNGTSGVLVLYGTSGTGFSTSKFTVLTVDDGLSPNNFSNHPACEPDGFHFCFVSRGHVVLSSADLDGDGKTELLIGAPNASQIRDDGTDAANGFEGVVAIVHGKSPSLSAFFGWSVLRPVRDVDEAAGFGSALAVGDFDADGKKDVAVGSPNNFAFVPDNAGIVRVFPNVQFLDGQGEAAPNVLSTVLTQDGIDTPEANDHFGAALAANDFNGDGASDLAVGAPGESTGSFSGNGEVNVIFGLTATGLSSTASPGHPAAQTFKGSNSREAFGSRFSAWNFGVSAEADLAIGVPFRDLVHVDRAGTLHTIAGAGAVVVMFGASQAVSATGFQSSQTWVQHPSGTPINGQFTTADGASAGNHFGASVY